MSPPAPTGEARFQPPFPPHATSPDPQPPLHPGAEALIDAAAKHVFPEPGMRTSGDDATRGVHQHGVGQTEGKSKEEEDASVKAEEQEPLIDGTPLDELQTPMFEEFKQLDSPASGAQAQVGGGAVMGRDMFKKKMENARRDTERTIREELRQESGDTIRPGRPSSGASAEVGIVQAERPGFGMSGQFGSVRMGASALVSALNALPWESEGESSDSDMDEEDSKRMSESVRPPGTDRPKISRLHSSLHTIRPMRPSPTSANTLHPQGLSPLDAASHESAAGPSTATQPQLAGKHSHLSFPFRANTIARRARSPGVTELEYQYALQEAEERRRERLERDDGGESDSSLGSVPMPKGYSEGDRRRSSAESELGSEAREILDDRIAKEESLGKEEEQEEILRAADEEHEGSIISGVDSLTLAPAIGENDNLEKELGERNTGAALREGTDQREVALEERMEGNISERKRLRRERLAGRLMEVFGLQEREEVEEEMRCWLLRSVMLKGYMYLTKRHICFFAHMPDRENLVVKTGPLHKKASRTKLSTKYWVVLKNDVLSWYESTADPYFPKGNVSLQYCSSCDPIDDTRFKLRTAERNYTFIAETEASRDEWIRSIKKVMFKRQHEGESVKLIIPLEAVLEVEKAPTLEFAETIEIKCIDPEDAMSVDSYFFASFQDDARALSRIQQLLEARPPSDLPRVPTPISQEDLDENQGRIGQGSGRRPSDSSSNAPTPSSGSGPMGIKKLGSVLKPFISRSSDDNAPSPSSSSTAVDQTPQSSGTSVFSIPFRKSTKPSHDSLETLRNQQPSPVQVGPHGEDMPEGYPPRQSGPPPTGFGEDKGWTPGWMRKPASLKMFGTSPSGSSGFLGKSPTEYGMTDAPTSPRRGRGERKRHSVTEVVEPLVPGQQAGDSDADEEEEEADAEDDDGSLRRGSGFKARLSWASGGSGSHKGKGGGDYSLMERSEGGEKEEGETVDKFRRVFALGDDEELIDHFPGYLYRVLPVSGRFFVSTNYFCFRSSQLLYKTKMIVPIRDLYGLKAQKAFRFGHSGLIVVIKGHEEIFLEFSSARRRKACVALLEKRMEWVRLQSGTEDTMPDEQPSLSLRIMEDLDESSPVEPRSSSRDGGGSGGAEPSELFGSTTSTFLSFKPEKALKVTCLTIGSRGDVQPYIALCKGLKAEGHEVRIATHGEYKDWVEGHGIEFASVGGDPAELMQMCVDNGMFTVSFLKEGLQKFRGWLDDLLNSSWKACQGSDLLIESPSAMGGIHIAEALRIPYFRAFTMPWTRTRAYPHAFAVPEHKRGGSYNYMTYTMFDQVFWRAISGQVNRFRKQVLGIESTTFDKLEQHKVPFLYNFSPNVVPPPLDWTEWIHVTGYWFLENADESAAKDSKWSPPEGLVDFIDGAHADGKKVVYIGFGSIVVSDPEEMTRCVVDAVVESGVCAILSKGWSDRGSKARGDEGGDSDGADGIKYPPEIFSIDSIDHSWLFPRVDAACHHGGAGTSGASLRAGIPTIIKPFFGDQAFWSERVESLNVGSAVRKLTVSHLADALRKATTDEKQIAKARIVGEMIRKENGVARAIEAIYRDLEYAKSLIKPLPEEKLEKAPSNLFREITAGSTDFVGGLVRPRSRSNPKRPPDGKVQRDRRRSSQGQGASASSPSLSATGRSESGLVGSGSGSASGGSMGLSREGSRDLGSEESWSVVSDHEG